MSWLPINWPPEPGVEPHWVLNGCELGGGAKLFSTDIRTEAAAALRLAAHGLHNSHSALLGAFLRRKKAQLGAPKAITATVHKLARLVFSMLKNGSDYVEFGEEEYERRYRARTIKNLQRKARSLGFHLVPHAPA